MLVDIGVVMNTYNRDLVVDGCLFLCEMLITCWQCTLVLYMHTVLLLCRYDPIRVDWYLCSGQRCTGTGPKSTTYRYFITRAIVSASREWDIGTLADGATSLNNYPHCS